MDDALPVALRRKYGLVHVPSRRKADQWLHEVRREIESGLPFEAAGLSAARSVFPYEAREIYASDVASVEQLLDRRSNGPQV